MRRPIIWILGISLVLRLIGSNQSFWLDESAQIIESSRPWSEQLNIPNDFHPPLYHINVHLFSYFGTSEWWLRLSSIIPGVLAIYFIYLIGRTMGNETVGNLAALLLATNPYHIYYSQELRMYSLSTMWACAAIYTLIKNKFYLHTLVIILGLYTLYLFPFMAGVEILFGIYLFLENKNLLIKKIKWICGSWILGIIFFLPIFPLLKMQMAGGMQLPKIWPGWRALSSVGIAKAIPLTLAKFVMGRITIESNLIYGGLTVVAGLIIATIGWLGRKSKCVWLGIIWLVFPVCIAFVISIWIPLNGPWRLLFALPGLTLILAGGLIKIPRHWAIKLLFLYLLLQLGGLTAYYANDQFQREPWNKLVNNLYKLNSISQGRMTVVSAFPEPFAPLRWYGADLDLSAPLDSLVANEESIDSKMKEITLNKDVVVRLEYLQDLTDPDGLISKWLDTHGFTVKDHLVYPNIGFAFIYQRDYQTFWSKENNDFANLDRKISYNK